MTDMLAGVKGMVCKPLSVAPVTVQLMVTGPACAALIPRLNTAPVRPPAGRLASDKLTVTTWPMVTAAGLAEALALRLVGGMGVGVAGVGVTGVGVTGA